MIQAAEQIFERNGEYNSLIWLAFVHDGKPRPLVFLIHDHGWWKGYPDLWDGQLIRFPYPGTQRGFAFLIEKAALGDLLGTPVRGEQPYQTDVQDDPWQFQDSYGRTLRLELPGMNVHVEYS